MKEEEEFPIENDITVLTEATFDKALQKYEDILVMFYAPFCINSKNLKPILEKAAAVLRKENIIVAKVDFTVEKKVTKKYKITGYPIVKFYKKGVATEYFGERKEKKIIIWARKKSGLLVKVLKTAEEVEAFQEENDVCVIYFGKDAEELKIFEGFALKIEDYPFGVVEDEDIAKKFNAKQKSVVLFKKFDEKRNDLETVKEKELSYFLERYSQKRVGNIENLEKVLYRKQPTIVYFGEKGDKWDEVEKIFEKIVENNYPKLKALMTEIEEGLAERFAKLVAVQTGDLPAVRIIDTRENMKKYKMEGNIDEQNILNFIKEWEEGKINAF